MQSRDRVVVITGAGSGIGRALALGLAAEGAVLALSDIDLAAVEETARLLPPATRSRVWRLDVASREAVFAHAEEVQRELGTAYMVFNNAGVTLAGTFDHQSIEEIEWLLGIDLWGVIHGCKAFLPQMLAAGEGYLVNISSAFGIIGFPMQSSYNIAKFGVRGLTECLWQELEGSGVKAISVHPGGIRTNIDKAARRAARADAEEERFDGWAEKALVTSPEECARQILDGIRRGRRRILPGKNASLIFWLARLFPNRYDRVLRAVLPRADQST